MIRNRRWFAFFSHTGSEIYKIYKKTGFKPEKIITTLPPGDERINKNLKKINTEFVYAPNKPLVEDYNRILSRCGGCVCTLHGWMRIIPKSVCEEYEFYNLHPGLITEYPELKGKDPQKRVLENTASVRGGFKEYEKIGLVIHRVTAGVDEGPIVAEASCRNNFNSEKAVTDKLKDMAVDTWLSVASLIDNKDE